MEATIAKIRKNRSAEIWVSLREYQGKQYVDIREHFLSDDDQAWHPTKKGVMVLSDQLPEVADGVLALADASTVGTLRTIRKSRDEVQIGLREYAGKRYADIRVWYLAENSERKPSPKGVTFSTELVESVAAALGDAQQALAAR